MVCTVSRKERHALIKLIVKKIKLPKFLENILSDISAHCLSIYMNINGIIQSDKFVYHSTIFDIR